MLITMIVTTVILIDLIIPSFIIIIISDVIIEPGKRRCAVICFASTGCSLIKKLRTAAAPLTCVYSMLRSCSAEKVKKTREKKGDVERGPRLRSRCFLLPACFNGFIKAPGSGRIKK